MASRSGALQEFAVADDVASPVYTVISGIDQGFTGFNLGSTPATFESSSGGIMTTKKAGFRVNDCFVGCQ